MTLTVHRYLQQVMLMRTQDMILSRSSWEISTSMSFRILAQPIYSIL